MSPGIWTAVTAVALLVARPALAASVEVDLTDQAGHPLPDAVIELHPTSSAPLLQPGALPRESVVDQRHETFLPLVSVIREGGDIVFTNNDTTMHQVYSFSAIKQFAFEVDQGQRSQPVVFDKPGVAAIGCNIHDQMITYVYVAHSPWTARTDANGHAVVSGIPPGSYGGTVWHPRLPAGRPMPTVAIVIAGEKGQLKQAISVHEINAAQKKSKHMDMY